MAEIESLPEYVASLVAMLALLTEQIRISERCIGTRPRAPLWGFGHHVGGGQPLHPIYDRFEVDRPS